MEGGVEKGGRGGMGGRGEDEVWGGIVMEGME